MFIPFEELSAQSRVWIYASKKQFTEDQKQIIKDQLNTFVNGWEAHGASLKASYKIEYDHFIVLAVDEAFHGASGCSIDKSVQVIRTIESMASVDLMDRLVAYVIKEQGVQVYPTSALKAAVATGELTSEDIVFDHSIASMEDYHKNWKRTAGATWLARYFTSVLK